MLQLLVTAPPNPSMGSAASTTSTNGDNICCFRCHSRAQRGLPKGPRAEHRATTQLGDKAALRPHREPVPRRAVLEPCGRQPAEPGPAALGAPEGSSQAPDSTLHSSQRGFATQPHACSAPLESEPGEALWGDAGPRLQPLVTCHQTALFLACTETLLRNAVPAATDGFQASSG